MIPNRMIRAAKNIRGCHSDKTCPRTPPERIKLVEFYDSAIGQELHADRRTSIEPLLETFKDALGIRAVPVKGSCNVKSYLCADLRFGVQLAAHCMHDWCRESSKNCKENALLLNYFRPYFCKPLCPSLK